jgi:hypothetical protein
VSNSSTVTFEGLRKRVRRLLKSARAGDAAALGRIEKVLPKHGTPPVLREVQQVLAREQGHPSLLALALEGDSVPS